MTIGVNLWTIYGWNLPERPGERVFSAIADLDVHAVELIVDEGPNSADELVARKSEIQGLLDRCQLTVPAIASTLFWRHNLGSKDDVAREEGTEIIRGMCRVAAEYGAQTVLVVAGQQEPHTPYALTWGNAVRSIREAAKTAYELGVLIGVENVGTSFLHTPGEMAQFIEEVDHPSVGAYLDLGNAMYGSGGYPENWCTGLAGMIFAVHVKDVDAKSGKPTYCGEGELRWQEVLPVLRECGYDRDLIIETPNSEGTGIEAGLEAMKRSVVGMRRILGK
jgi:hexulose-6-phosphate isomerase